MSTRIDYQRFRCGEFCVEEGCRARKFYIEDGKKFCKRGHEQTGFIQTQQDEDDWNAQGKKSRKRRDESSRSKTILKGDHARELYLQCYQLILWKQCHWLVSVKRLPGELETIVRDLWGLKLGFINVSQKERSGYSSGTGTGTMMLSSTSDGEYTDTDGSGFKSQNSRISKKSTKRNKADKLPKLMETLGLLYLGTLMLRLPVSLGEISKWVTRDEIIFNRAVKEVPNDMRVKLPSYLQSALEVRAPFNGNTLHKTILGLVAFFSVEFGLHFPPINVPLLLFKHVRNLGLPVEIYPAVQRLSSMLERDFSYPILQEGLRSFLNPEVCLVTLVVVATKLCQPFDSIIRVPTSDADPSAIRLNWGEWREIMEDSDLEILTRGKEMEAVDSLVMDLDGRKVDDYLDWFQRVWLDDRALKVPETILDKFPLPEPPSPGPKLSGSQKHLSKLKRVQMSMVSQEGKIGKELPDGSHWPGDQYRRYRKVEDIPQKAMAFFALAAENVGIHVELLVRVVYEAEGWLMKWNLEQRRQQMREEEAGSDGAP